MKKEFAPSGFVMGELVLVTKTINMAGGTNENLPGFNKDSPACEVVDFWYNLDQAGPAASSTITLRHGDGASSESFNAISNALAVGTSSAGSILRATSLSATYKSLSADQSLNISSVASTGNHQGTVCALVKIK